MADKSGKRKCDAGGCLCRAQPDLAKKQKTPNSKIAEAVKWGVIVLLACLDDLRWQPNDRYMESRRQDTASAVCGPFLLRVA